MKKTRSYSQYKEDFLIHSQNQGLRYTLFQLFTLIPAGIGRILDAMLGLDRGENMKSPFSFLFGIIPGIVGLILGQALQILINTPTYLAHYLLDKPISWILEGVFGVREFDTAATNDVNDGYRLGWLGEKILALIITPAVKLNMLLGAFIHDTPKQMQGPFGFYVGAIPEIARFVIFKVAQLIVVPVKMTTDFISSNITAAYQWLFSTSTTTSDASKDSARKPRKPARFKRAANCTMKADHLAAMKLGESLKAARLQFQISNTDIFELLGTSYEAYNANNNVINSGFKKLALQFHPDRMQNATESEQQAAQTKLEACRYARDILSDNIEGGAYIKWYKSKFKNNAPKSNPNPNSVKGLNSNNNNSKPQPKYNAPNNARFGDNQHTTFNQNNNNNNPGKKPRRSRIKRPTTKQASNNAFNK